MVNYLLPYIERRLDFCDDDIQIIVNNANYICNYFSVKDNGVFFCKDYYYICC